jgi:hypothetical protein
MESVEVINQRLLDQFGRFEDGRPNWRVVWSDDQLEKRFVTHTKEGFELPSPVAAEVRKYSYIVARYVLEKIVPVPQIDGNELTTKTSYEPIWTFEDSHGNALPPIYDAISLLIRTVNENLYRAGRNIPYKTPEGMGNTAEEQKMRADKLYQELYGNETSVSDALSLDTAVGYGTRQRKDWTH